jgi:hypothetical protein
LSSRKRNSRTLVAGILLVAFGVRALIPAGFMPASDRPFSIEICSEGFPADMLARGEPPHADSVGMHSVGMDSVPAHSMAADSMHDSMHPQAVRDRTPRRGPLPGAHHRHSGSPWNREHCVFGTACSAGPIPHLPLPSDISSGHQLRVVAFVSIAGAIRLVHLPQPRAPPRRLS